MEALPEAEEVDFDLKGAVVMEEEEDEFLRLGLGLVVLAAEGTVTNWFKVFLGEIFERFTALFVC